MSEQMTVERVVRENEWSGKFGKNQAYSLDLRLADGRIEMGVTSNRKLKEGGSHNEPHESEVIWGDIVPDGRGGEKLQIDYEAVKEHGGGAPPQFSSSSESSTSNTSKGSSGETDWTVRNAEIRRQHSQQVAIEALTLLSPQAATEASYFRTAIKDWADWFDQDAIAAGQKASQGQLPPPTSPTATETQSAAPGSPPVDLSGARTSEPGPVYDDEHQWFANELNVGGASLHAASVLATFATEKLLPEQRKILEGELKGDDESKRSAFKRIEVSYTRTEGHPVPSPQDDPTIPF